MIAVLFLAALLECIDLVLYCSALDVLLESTDLSLVCLCVCQCQCQCQCQCVCQCQCLCRLSVHVNV